MYLLSTWDVQFRDIETQIKFKLKFISPIPLPLQPSLLQLSHLTDALKLKKLKLYFYTLANYLGCIFEKTLSSFFSIDLYNYTEVCI